MRCALVVDGVPVRFGEFDSPPQLASNKGAWLPTEAQAAPGYTPATQTLSPAVTVEADKVIEGYSVEAIPLADQKATAHLARIAEFSARIAAGCAVASLHVQIDDGSRANLTALGATALGVIGGVIPAWPEDYAKGWVSVEGDRIPLADAQAGLNLALAAGAFYAGLVQHDQDLADAIDAAADADALQAIDVAAGW